MGRKSQKGEWRMVEIEMSLPLISQLPPRPTTSIWPLRLHTPAHHDKMEKNFTIKLEKDNFIWFIV